MRVLFLTLYPQSAASPRYRVGQFLPYLRGHGVEYTVASPLTNEELAVLTGPNRRHRPLCYHATEIFRRFKQLLTASSYDIVFVQKAVMTAYLRGVPELLRQRARRLVYDMDDAVYLDPPHPLRFPWTTFEEREQIAKLCHMSDLVLAGNAWLTEQARQWNPHAVLFPTVVDTERFRAPFPSEKIGVRNGYRIGWVGNPSTTICLEPAAEALDLVADAEVRLIGADAARVPITNATALPWRHEQEVEDLRAFDIGIMPQPRTPWMRGKCALKALQYMACGIPCVASPFGAVEEFMVHDHNGLFADTTAEWLDAFARLRDPALRERLGQAGRRTVEQRYSVCRAAPKLLELLGGFV